MTWPKSTWTAWKSDSTNPSLLVLLRGEGLDPWSCILDLCSCLLSPCIQLWLSSSPCLDEMSSAIKDWLRKLTGQLVTYYWNPFLLFPAALWSNLYSFVPLYICQTRGHWTGVHFIYDRCQGSRTTCCTPWWQDSKSSAVSCLIMNKHWKGTTVDETTGWLFCVCL